MAIYLDHNATSPMHPQAVDAMLPRLRARFLSTCLESISIPSAFRHTKYAGPRALVVNKKPKHVLISGGYQENRRRGVNESGAGIFGVGEAARLAGLEMEHKKHQLKLLREVTRPSHVLSAMGAEDNLALKVIRVRENSLQDVEAFMAKLLALVNKLPAVFRQAAR